MKNFILLPLVLLLFLNASTQITNETIDNGALNPASKLKQ